MYSETIRGKWLIFKGRIKERVGRLIGDESLIAEGKNAQLSGRVALRYSSANTPRDQHTEKMSHLPGG